MHRMMIVAGMIAAGTLAAAPAAATADAVPANATPVVSPSPAGDRVLPPGPWVQQDPADSLWRAARQALDRGDNAGAAATYSRIRTEQRYATSAYRSHAFYWEAFARHRIGSTAEMRTALGLLDRLRTTHPQFENMAEAERLRASITASLAARGDAPSAQRAAATVSQAARCPDQDLRAAAVESLITMPAQQAMPLLEQVMARRDECNAKLRETAVFMIAQKGGARASDMLLDAVRNDPAPAVREQAVFWLSRVDGDRAVDAIQEVLRTSSEPKLLEMSVFALSQHSSPRAGQLLRDIATRQGTPAEVRKNAIFFMGRSADPQTGAFLRGIYGSTSDAGVKEAVIHALSQRERENHSDWLLEIAMNTREPLEARKQALFWAGRQGTLPLNRLGELYGTMPGREMREQIIFAISQRREPEALDRLIEMARRETDAELRRNLIFWIGRHDDPRAARFLAEIIGG